MTISELFSDPPGGLGVLGEASRAQLRRDGFGDCLDREPGLYAASASNYRQFALTPDGLRVEFEQAGYCGPAGATVRYDVLRPYLSKLGATLIAGVRRPQP